YCRFWRGNIGDDASRAGAAGPLRGGLAQRHVRHAPRLDAVRPSCKPARPRRAGPAQMGLPPPGACPEVPQAMAVVRLGEMVRAVVPSSPEPTVRDAAWPGPLPPPPIALGVLPHRPGLAERGPGVPERPLIKKGLRFL